MIAKPNLLVWCILVASLAGCAGGKPVVVSLDVTGVQPGVRVDDLGKTLRRAVEENGFIDADKFQDVATTLRKQLRLLAVTGPTVTPALYPTPNDRLAYWYNARTAWSMELAMRLHREKTDDAARLANLAFPLDGRTMRLAQIDAVIEALGGYVAVIAAPCANLHRAALPQTPFSAPGIRQAVQDRFIAFVDDPRRFFVDIEKQTIHFPSILWRYRDEIFAANRREFGTPQATLTSALLPRMHGSALRRLQNAIGYRCVEDTRPGALSVME